MQHVFERKEFFPFALHEFRYGNTRPATHDFSDVFFGNFVVKQIVIFVGSGFFFAFGELFFKFGQFSVTEFRRFIEVVFSFGFFGFAVDRFDLFAEFLHFIDSVLFGL